MNYIIIFKNKKLKYFYLYLFFDGLLQLSMQYNGYKYCKILNLHIKQVEQQFKIKLGSLEHKTELPFPNHKFNNKTSINDLVNYSIQLHFYIKCIYDPERSINKLYEEIYLIRNKRWNINNWSNEYELERLYATTPTKLE